MGRGGGGCLFWSYGEGVLPFPHPWVLGPPPRLGTNGALEPEDLRGCGDRHSGGAGGRRSWGGGGDHVTATRCASWSTAPPQPQPGGSQTNARTPAPGCRGSADGHPRSRPCTRPVPRTFQPPVRSPRPRIVPAVPAPRDRSSGPRGPRCLPGPPAPAPGSPLPGTLGGPARPAPWSTGLQASTTSSGSSRP